MIIDIHTHPLDSDPFTGEPLSPEESSRISLEQMDLAKVSRAGLLGSRVFAGQSEHEVRDVNDFTAAVVHRCPERFFGMAFINPALPPQAVAGELERCLSRPEFRAVKLEVDLCCRDPRLNLVAEYAIKYNVPVLHHSWYINFWNLGEIDRREQRNRSEPHDIADFARRFPQLRIIMAHLEGTGIRGLIDIADCPNVWVDTSGSLPFSGTLEFALKTLGRERILFGSDLPYRGYESQLGRILGSRLSTADLEPILHRNAETLFFPNLP